jgi:molybdate transport system substrate-binding protein
VNAPLPSYQRASSDPVDKARGVGNIAPVVRTMQMMPAFRVLTAAAGAWLAALACATSAHAVQISVSAAASLRDALASVNLAYEERNHEDLSTVYGPSLRLARDIERGAVPDVFISADPESVDYLQRRGLVRADMLITLVKNVLVVVVPATDRTKTRLQQKQQVRAFLETHTLSLPDPTALPAGKFGEAALKNLGLWDTFASRIRVAPNARGALEKLETREADAAIIYRSQALSSKGVRIVDTLPDGSYPPIVYTISITTAGQGPAIVSAYVNFVRSQLALDMFERYGFVRPP